MKLSNIFLRYISHIKLSFQFFVWFLWFLSQLQPMIKAIEKAQKVNWWMRSITEKSQQSWPKEASSVYRENRSDLPRIGNWFRSGRTKTMEVVLFLPGGQHHLMVMIAAMTMIMTTSRIIVIYIWILIMQMMRMTLACQRPAPPAQADRKCQWKANDYHPFLLSSSPLRWPGITIMKPALRSTWLKAVEDSCLHWMACLLAAFHCQQRNSAMLIIFGIWAMNDALIINLPIAQHAMEEEWS